MDAALRTLPLETLQSWLSEALVARHAIMQGKKPTYVLNAGQARSFNLDKLEELNQYIADLNAAIVANAAAAAGRCSGGPIHYGMGF